MNAREGITTFVAFGIAVIVGLLVVLMDTLPIFADSNLLNPFTGGFSSASASALLGLGLLLAVLTLAFTPVLAAEILVVRAGNLTAVLEVLGVLALLSIVLLFVVADGTLIAISFALSLPFAGLLSSKIPVERKKDKVKERWTW
jgi:hypothetical protein